MDRGDRYFLTVARTGSLRRAAEQLHVASSAISRQVMLLEESLGIELFERASHGMILTAAGEIYQAYVRGATNEAERVRSELDALKGLHRGHIKIYSVEGVTGDLVMKACLAFRRKFPGVTLDLTIAGSHVVAQAVRARDADVGISMNASGEPGISIIHSLEDPLLAVMAPDHELSGSPPRHITEITSKYKVALPPPSFGIRSLVDACLREKAEPVLVTNSIEALRAFARLEGGVTFLPYLAVREELGSGRVASVELCDPLLTGIVIDVYIMEGRQLPPAAREFLTFLDGTL